MALKRARRWCIALIVVLALYATYRCTLHLIVKARLDEIRTQGYPVTLTELDKWYPQPPPGENAADIYLQAFAHSDRFWGTNWVDQSSLAITNEWPYWSFAPYERYQLLPVVGVARLPSGCPPLPKEMKQLLATYVSDNGEALQLLHKAAGKIRCRYPIDFTKIYQEDELGEEERRYFPHWGNLEFCAKLLQVESILRAENGDARSAADSILALLALARSLRNEPDSVAHMVRCNIESAAVSALEHSLNRTSFPASQVERLQPSFLEAESARQMIFPVVGEFCEGNAALETDPWLLFVYGGLAHMERSRRSTLPIGLKLIDRLYGALGLFDLDQLRFSNYVSEKIEVIRKSSDLPDSSLKVGRLPSFPLFYRVSVPLHSMTGESRARALLREACLAISVERYVLRRGKPPDSITELEPEFLGQIPADPFDGQLLRYKKLAKGYVVYSIGEDGKDDGGDEKKDITFTVER